MQTNTLTELTGEYIQAVKDALTAAGQTIHWDETTVPDATDLWLTPIEANPDSVVILGWRESERGWYLAECLDGARYHNHRLGLSVFADPADVAEKVAARMREPKRVKGRHPADGSGRWSVVGAAGKVVYDLLGNHLALIPVDGEIEAVMGPTLAAVWEYARLGEDDLVFGILDEQYRTQLAGGAR